MAEAIKISALPGITIATMGPEDQLVINDVQPGTQEITSRIAVGSFVNWITGQDLNFTGDISFLGIKPNPNNPNDFNIEADNITINKSITLGPNADINGLYVDDLEDVEIDTGLLKKGQVLMWDDTDQKWFNGSVTIDNFEDTVESAVDDSVKALTDSIYTLYDEIEVLNTEINQLKYQIQGSIDPAPDDNNLYVMQNGQWVQLPETFSINRDL